MGKGLALLFAGKGWDVAITYNRSAEGAFDVQTHIQSMGQKCEIASVDVRKRKEIELAFDYFSSKIGKPDVLINNAAMFPANVPFRELPEDNWNNTINNNLNSVYLVSQVFLSHAATPGRIINIASLGGIEVWKGRAAYHASKAAVIHLTHAMALELAPDVAVNAISPGTIVFSDEAPPEPVTPSESRIPMERYGTIKDIFDAANFFATCTTFITGQNIIVDGGYALKR